MKFIIKGKDPILISADHAIPGEIFGEFPRLPQSEIFYPILYSKVDADESQVTFLLINVHKGCHSKNLFFLNCRFYASLFWHLISISLSFPIYYVHCSYFEYKNFFEGVLWSHDIDNKGLK